MKTHMNDCWGKPNMVERVPKSTRAAAVQVDPPLNERLILCLCKFFASFVLILYITASLTP